MRYLVLAVLTLTLMSPARSQTEGVLTVNDVALKAQDAFRKAKTASDTESVKSWCTASIKGASAAQRITFIKQMKTLIEADKPREANLALEKMKSLDEQDENMVSLVCNPR
jgi:hypothetical protein